MAFKFKVLNNKVDLYVFTVQVHMHCVLLFGCIRKIHEACVCVCERECVEILLKFNLLLS
uniref:Uncharacterized protein n=1 Tax=Octopus bimaculoides TaxID=37653 RepID=A0A0L8FW47_OCTBM